MGPHRSEDERPNEEDETEGDDADCPPALDSR